MRCCIYQRAAIRQAFLDSRLMVSLSLIDCCSFLLAGAAPFNSDVLFRGVATSQSTEAAAAIGSGDGITLAVQPDGTGAASAKL